MKVTINLEIKVKSTEELNELMSRLGMQDNVLACEIVKNEK